MTAAEDPGVRLRPANPEDAGAIGGLSAELGYPTEVDALAERIRRMSSDPGHCVTVAESGSVDSVSCVGWIHGFEALRVEGESFVEIGGLVVARPARRSGVGRSLMAAVIRWAKDSGIPTVRVRCREERHEAHLFYRELGFTEIKRQRIFECRL